MHLQGAACRRRSIRTVVGSREGGGWLRALPRMVDVASSKWQVTAILVLHGLPWLLTGSILAHEVCDRPPPL